MRMVYWNGKYIPEAEARISIYDSALMYGDMVFEMTRSFKCIQFKLKEHIERLYAGLKILRIPMTMTEGDMFVAVKEAVDKNFNTFADDDEHRVMINVTRGLLPAYHGNVDGVKPGTNVIISVYPLRWSVRGMGVLFAEGIAAVTVPQRQIPAQYLDPKIKHRSRLHYRMAELQAGGRGWPLLLDDQGFITEGTGANFFIVAEDRLWKPAQNILNGISQYYVATELDEPAYQSDIEQYHVHHANEAFLTATPFCMLPVTSLDGLPIGDGKVGPVFKRLLAQWSTNVGVDIEAQIKGWDAQ